MRYLLFALVAWGALALSGQAQDATQRIGVEATIQLQMDAFNDQDPATAFQYASPFIQNMFGTAENFGMMVQKSYPMVWNNADVAFFEQRPEGGMLLQRVRVRDRTGGEYWFAYQMVQVEGQWRINGVFPLKAPDIAA